MTVTYVSFYFPDTLIMLYKPFVSKAKNKKYSVYVKGPGGKPKLIHFGDKRYGQYQDKIGHYRDKDTKDKKGAIGTAEVTIPQ